MKKKYYSKISFTMDSDHPDIALMDDWMEDKVYELDDTYTLDPDYFGGDDAVMEFIRGDLALVAGGGYNTAHIHNVHFDIRKQEG